MRNTDERMEIAKRRSNEMIQRKQKKVSRWIITGTGICSLALVVILGFVVSYIMNSTSNHNMNTEMTASIFTNNPELGYIIIGILAFALGICVTLLCIRLNKQEDRKKATEKDIKEER